VIKLEVISVFDDITLIQLGYARLCSAELCRLRFRVMQKKWFMIHPDFIENLRVHKIVAIPSKRIRLRSSTCES
jgi:hypothetical protein